MIDRYDDCYAELVLKKLVDGPMTTASIMAIKLKKGGTILRPAAAIEDIRDGTQKRPRFTIHTIKKNNSGMALYYMDKDERERARKYLGITTNSKRAA